MMKTSANNAQNDFFWSEYLPTNDTITRFTLNNPDLLFQGIQYDNLISRKHVN